MRDMLPAPIAARCRENALWLALDLLPHLCRLGVPERVLEAAMGWQPGILRRWRALPRVPDLRCPRDLADACAAAAAEAEAELAVTLHRRGQTDPKAAQWLLERRAPERWSQASPEALEEARRAGAEAERGRLERAGWRPPEGDDSGRLVLPLKE